MIHTVERHYPWDKCNKAFTTSSQLKTHARVHSGETPFECRCCGIGFAQPVTLEDHEHTNKNIHSGMTRFSLALHVFHAMFEERLLYSIESVYILINLMCN